MGMTVGAHLENLAVKLDHLAVESVESAQSEITMSLKLAHRHVAGRCTFHQGVHGRGLEGGLVLVAQQAFESLYDDGRYSLSGLFTTRAELARQRRRQMNAKRKPLMRLCLISHA